MVLIQTIDAPVIPSSSQTIDDPAIPSSSQNTDVPDTRSLRERASALATDWKRRMDIALKCRAENAQLICSEIICKMEEFNVKGKPDALLRTVDLLPAAIEWGESAYLDAIYILSEVFKDTNIRVIKDAEMKSISFEMTEVHTTTTIK